MSNDVVIRELVIRSAGSIRGALVYIDGMIHAKILNDNVISPLIHCECRIDMRENSADTLGDIGRLILPANQVSEVKTLRDAYSGFLSGDAVLFADGEDRALVINAKGWEQRAVDEPGGEAVVRGPRECFVENIRTNTSLLRRKIRNPDLIFEAMTVGERTKTNVMIAYLSGLAKAELVDMVKARLGAISADAILESGYIEQYIEDSPGSLFATVGYTEKPDTAAAKILEGRVAILVDGTPFVLTVPLLFIENFQSSEDYYFRPYFATLLRIVRFIGYFTTLFAPALYVAITTFHRELIPISLLFTMAAAREGIPFPAFVESLIMIITFEILREAGVRLPRSVGQALSIVGALVVGEAAVSAGLIGAPMVIVVAITAVSGFVVPNLTDSAAVLRFIYLILGAVLGGFGITLGFLGTLVHASALESFGYPFLSPIAPFDPTGTMDLVIRAPLRFMIRRPKGLAADIQRRKANVLRGGDGDGGSGL